jgi:hypothetical protein
MPLLKKNSTGPAVARLIQRLVAVGYLPAGTGGNLFDNAVFAAVKRFQAKHMGPNGLPLVIDGEVGPLTEFALSVALGELPEPPNNSMPLPQVNAAPAGASIAGWNALQAAKAEMAAGAKEIGGHDSGPFCRKYLAVTGLDEGFDWCAAFVSFCFKDGNPGAMPYTPTAGSRATLKAFRDRGWAYDASFENPPIAGDIIVWWRGSITGWRGHIGIVAGYEHGIVHTIEGNRTPRVEAFSYTFGQIDRLLGFGRAKPVG